MGKVVTAIVGVGLVVAGAVTGNFALIVSGLQIAGSALLAPKGKPRAASATTVQVGEVPRQAIFGEAATAGSLNDAFNYGGKYGTDWEVLVLTLADHRCAGLTGFYVADQYVPFTGDGDVAGYRGQLRVWWRSGTADQTLPAVLTQNGWSPTDIGAGVAYVVVAYKADGSDAKNPVWPGGRPRFLWVVRGALCYDPRRDSSVGGSGPQRWTDPTTREWSENPIVCRYTWVRGLYACDQVADPAQLLIGRGLSAVEAPPGNVFHRANLCDEIVDGAPRYRVSAIVDASAKFIAVEEDFAAACAGTIVQPEGSVEIDPGEARAAVVTITDDDLLVGSKVVWNNRMLGTGSAEWVNTVVARYVEPTLKWADHAAPVRREVADIIADRQPREQRADLGFVRDGAQAGRIAEVLRRLGRLHGRAEITLPPRFAALEEGDWIIWHSPRRFGGVAFTFRVEAWGSNAAWHHQLSLRQVSASIYSDTDPLDDGSIKVLPPAPPPIGAPAAGAWVLDAGYQTAGGLQQPVLIVTGISDDRDARFIRMEYALGDSTVWTDAGVTGPDVTRREIPVAAGGGYRVAVAYVVNGFTGDRLVLGPVGVGSVLYPDGTPVEAVQPAEPGATNSADPNSPFGPGKVRDVLATVNEMPGLREAVAIITDTPDVEAMADGARAAADRARSSLIAQLGDQLSAQARKASDDARQHIAGVPVGMVINRVDRERQDGDQQLAESVSTVAASVRTVDGRVTGEVQRIDQSIADKDRAQALALTTVKAELAEDIDGVDQRVTGEVERIDQSIADKDRAQALALTTVKAELAEDIDGVDQRVTGEVERIDQSIADKDRAQALALTTVKAELADDIDGVDQRVTGEVDRIDRVVVAGDKANADSITDVTTELNGQKASVQLLLRTVDGKEAVAQLVTDVNGRITGFKINGVTQDFAVHAKRFTASDPDTGKVYWYADADGNVIADNVRVNTFQANSINAEALLAGAAGITTYCPVAVDTACPRNTSTLVVSFPMTKVDDDSDLRIMSYTHIQSPDDIDFLCQIIVDGAVRQTAENRLPFDNAGSRGKVTLTPFAFLSGIAAGQHTIAFAVTNNGPSTPLTVKAGYVLEVTEMRRAVAATAVASTIAPGGTGGGDGSGGGGSGGGGGGDTPVIVEN